MPPCSTTPPVARRLAFASRSGAPTHGPRATTAARVEPGLRADRTVVGRCTYLRLTGVVDAFFPYARLADGLEGTVILDLADVRRVHATGAIAWRRFLRTVVPLTDRTYLLGVPPRLVEEMTCTPELDRGARILTLELPYRCTGCTTVAHYFIATHRHHDDLARGRAPALSCRDCGGPLASAASPSFLARLACLPPVTPPRRVRALLRQVHGLKPGPGAPGSPDRCSSSARFRSVLPAMFSAPSRSTFSAVVTAATVVVLAAATTAAAVVVLAW